MALTGCIAGLLVWIELQNVSIDSVKLEAINGMEVQSLTIPLILTQSGTYHLWARVMDVNGLQSGTGLIRTIVVK